VQKGVMPVTAKSRNAGYKNLSSSKEEIMTNANNHRSVPNTAADELRDEQLDQVTGGIIAVLIGMLSTPEVKAPPPPSK
jgi:hypothetical protein